MEQPLVSVCFMCCNRKEYVARALESVMLQTYRNLEVLISDDCSTDGTSEIIRRIIAKYPERNVWYNRNEKNIGIIRNAEKCFEYVHGELVVLAHDDDVSRSDRVEKIVSAWISTRKQATAIIHGWYKINANGHFVGEQDPWGPVGEWDARELKSEYLRSCWPLGAAMAFIPRCFFDFPRVTHYRGFEDVVYLSRAMMLGYPLYIKDRLLYYRLGTGTTTSYDVRKAQMRQFVGGVDGFDQAFDDLKTCSSEFCRLHYAQIEDAFARHKKDFNDVGRVFSLRGKELREALRDSQNLMLQSTLPRQIIVPLLYLPKIIGNPVMNTGTRLLWFLRMLRYRYLASRWIC